jgi:hypothetical protein
MLSFESSHVSSACPSDKRSINIKISMKHWWNVQQVSRGGTSRLLAMGRGITVSATAWPEFQNSVHRTENTSALDCVWNVMTHAQKPDFVFRRNGRVHLNRRGRQFSRLLAAEVCASGVVMLDTPCSEVVWRVLATHSIHQFPLHFPSRTSPFAITFQLDSTNSRVVDKCAVWESDEIHNYTIWTECRVITVTRRGTYC